MTNYDEVKIAMKHLKKAMTFTEPQIINHKIEMAMNHLKNVKDDHVNMCKDCSHFGPCKDNLLLIAKKSGKKYNVEKETADDCKHYKTE